MERGLLNAKLSSMAYRILEQSFFARPVLQVAEELIGKYLVCMMDGKKWSGMITEVEAYDGPNDKACHGYKGRTERTKVMFGEAGYWYVYLIYGMYYMLNIVTGEEGYPAAVLIRGAGEYEGPGKLTKHLGITKEKNEKKSAKKTKLWIEDRGDAIAKNQMERTPRIGVDYAAEWAKKPYRFVLK